MIDQLKQQSNKNEELESNLNGVNIQLQKFIDKVRFKSIHPSIYLPIDHLTYYLSIYLSILAYLT